MKKEIEIKETSYGWVEIDIDDDDTEETIKEKVMEIVNGGNACFGDMEVEII